jgi:hypothetical protein
MTSMNSHDSISQTSSSSSCCSITGRARFASIHVVSSHSYLISSFHVLLQVSLQLQRGRPCGENARSGMVHAQEYDLSQVLASTLKLQRSTMQRNMTPVQTFDSAQINTNFFIIGQSQRSACSSTSWRRCVRSDSLTFCLYLP